MPSPRTQSRGNARGLARNTKQIQFGPLIGLRDSLDPMLSNDPKRAVTIENLFPLELDKPSVFVGVPGVAQAGAQGGVLGKRTTQIIYQLTKLDGTEITLRVVGGQGIQTLNWTTMAWTTVVTVANLATASITLSETTRCYGLTFTNLLYFSDGTNLPWTWDGTAGAGGLASITNAPVLYGQPTIYYAKVMGIKASEPNVFVWSEENDATIGYEQPAYLNTWQLGQTDQERLFAIVGTNDRLYYLRRDSAGAITGAVTPTFQTDGTKEGVDETIGTLSPACLIFRDNRIFFLDSRGRPHYASAAGGAVGVWQDIHELLSTLDRTKLDQAIGVYDPATQLVLFGVVEIGQTYCSAIIAFNPVLNVPVAVWRGFTFTALAIVKNADGDSVIMHGDADGYTYVHGLPTGDLWDHALVSGTVPIRHTVESAHLGANVRSEKRYSRVDVTFRADGEATSIGVSVETTYGASPSLSADVSGASTRWDEFDWDEENWASDSVEQHVAFGLNNLGRWARVRVSHESLGEQFGFEAGAIEYAPAGDPMAAR